ncbi:MAG: hypothetical protein JO297_15465 [Nitrososphaeraceae archaeon]|nr:hypothetical protein [Nitrososphaeraceae archaeon]
MGQSTPSLFQRLRNVDVFEVTLLFKLPNVMAEEIEPLEEQRDLRHWLKLTFHGDLDIIQSRFSTPTRQAY